MTIEKTIEAGQLELLQIELERSRRKLEDENHETEYRKECRAIALHNLDLQTEHFKLEIQNEKKRGELFDKILSGEITAKA